MTHATGMNPVEAYCRGKAGFVSFALANGVATRRRRAEHHLHPYRCPTCHLWHLSGRKKHSGG